MTKNQVNYWLVLLAMFTLGLSACKKDSDTPNPNSEIPEISIADKEELITFSSNMRSSSNIYAIQTVAYGSLVNSLHTSNRTWMTIGSEANFNSGCWTWSDGAGTSVRYCLTETATNYNFTGEVAISGSPLRKVYEGTERKDGSSGDIDYFDIDTGVQLANLSWTVVGATTTWTYTGDDAQLKVIYNESTQTGSVEAKEDGTLVYEATWNNLTCSGTYTDYEVPESGSWTCQ